jgi:hypothetical protein
MFTLQAFSMGSYQRLAMFLLRLKAQKQAPWSPGLEKPKKPFKTKFVAKSPLKNKYRYKAYSCKTYSRTISF